MLLSADQKFKTIAQKKRETPLKTEMWYKKEKGLSNE